MPDTLTGTALEIREDLDKLIKRVNDLDATVNDRTRGLAERIAILEIKIAELEKT
jgi:uncharacterized coiled-coil protein SlyX